MKLIDEPLFETEFQEKQPAGSDNVSLRDRIHQLLSEQKFCVLSTQGQSQPYGSLIAFAFTDNLKYLYFTTPVATRKFKLLKECHRIALLVDSRCQHLADMTQVEAVTITARARHVTSGELYKTGINMLKTRHPYLKQFLEAESTALFQAAAVRYFHVGRFQEVAQWIP